MTVSLQFLGAAHTVTGSCYLVETGRVRFLVDCGLFQGSKTLKALNYGEFAFAPREIDLVLLTHAHIDHSGLIPKLVREGFTGPVYATRGTRDLCSYMLPDAGFIQEMEVENLNRRNRARGRDAVEPIYTVQDAKDALRQFRSIGYEAWIEVESGIRARFWNAGHLLGSSSIEIEIAGEGPEGGPMRLLFSGDIGPQEKLLQPDPQAPSGFDYVICESTYGDRDRPEVTAAHRQKGLIEEVREAAQHKGALLIPAFAVERTQELIVDLVSLMERGDIPKAPIFLDSPLAIRATDVFRKHAASLDNGIDLERILRSPWLRFTESVEESKAIARFAGFHIIIAASGMCDAGRIRHHLKRWLWHKDATVLLVGYQAQGTLGRFLEEGVEAVRIQGEEIRVSARIRKIEDYSGHADGPELARWIAERCPIRTGLFLVHGEEASIDGLYGRVAQTILPADRIHRPQLDDIFDLGAKTILRHEPNTARRLPPEKVINLDWHNDLSRLILDISSMMDRLADDRARGVLVRRLRRALDEPQ